MLYKRSETYTATEGVVYSICEKSDSRCLVDNG